MYLRLLFLAAIAANTGLLIDLQAEGTDGVKWGPERPQRTDPAAKGPPGGAHPGQHDSQDAEFDPVERADQSRDLGHEQHHRDTCL